METRFCKSCIYMPDSQRNPIFKTVQHQIHIVNNQSMKSGAHILVKDSEDTQYLGDQKLLQMNAHENLKKKIKKIKALLMKTSSMKIFKFYSQLRIKTDICSCLLKFYICVKMAREYIYILLVIKKRLPFNIYTHYIANLSQNKGRSDDLHVCIPFADRKVGRHDSSLFAQIYLIELKLSAPAVPSDFMSVLRVPGSIEIMRNLN